MMAASLGPPEVIAQLENAAKVLMVSAPRPTLASAAFWLRRALLAACWASQERAA